MALGDFLDTVPPLAQSLKTDLQLIEARLVPLEAAQAAMGGGGGAAVINAAVDFGVVGDNSTDNSTALQTMRTFLLQDTSQLYRVYFPPGIYRYSNNRWLWGVQRVIIDAYGVSFMGTANLGLSIDNGPAYTGDPFIISNAGPQASGATYSSGFRFNTAAIGATTVSMATAGQAANFAAGNRVLIHGYEQQPFEQGYPPNMRYFEWNVVASVNTGANTVTFETPLSFSYDTRWWDVTWGSMSIGKPRIINLDRANYHFPKFIHIKGATFLANDTSPSAPGNFFQFPAERLIMEDVHSRCFFWPSMNRFVHLLRCRIDPQFEIDKLVSDIVVEDCDVMSETMGGTGVHRCRMLRSRLRGRTEPQCKYLHYVDCDFYGDPTWDYGLLLMNQLWNSHALTVEGCNFYNIRGASLNYAINTGVLYSLTVGSVSGTNIRMTWNSTSKNVAASLDVGMTLFKSDLSKTGKVTAMYHDGGNPGNLVIEGTWAAPVGGETWNWRWGEKLHDGGGNTVIGPQAPLWRDASRVTGI